MMSTYTRRRHGPQEQQKVGESLSQRGVVPVSREAAEDHPFPVKPVSYRGSLQEQAQFHTSHFERLSISPQPEDLGYLHSNEDSHRIPSEELELDRVIHVRKLVLEENLCRVIEKIRQNLQMDEEERGERRQEMQRRDVQQSWRKKDQKTERFRTRNDKPETGRGDSGMLREGVYGEQRKSRWQNVKEQTRRKGADEMDEDVWGKTFKKSHIKTSKGETNQAAEVKYKERVKREMNISDLIHNTEQKAARGSRGVQSGKSCPPVVSKEQLADGSLETLPCKICNRKFVRERLEKHVNICKKVKQARRPVYNSYAHRTKGSSAEEFFKTHTRSKTPEIIKKKYQGQKETRNTSDRAQSRPPAAIAQSKTSKKTQLQSRN